MAADVSDASRTSYRDSAKISAQRDFRLLGRKPFLAQVCRPISQGAVTRVGLASLRITYRYFLLRGLQGLTPA